MRHPPRIALVKPHSRGINLKGAKETPTGLIGLASILIQEGLETDLFDGSFYKDAGGGDDCTDQLIKDVADFNPDILGIAAYTDTMPECERILNCLSKAPIKICGGPHASARPQELLRYCDAAFAGEAEPSMRAFARSVMKCGLPSLSSLERISGVATRSGQGVGRPSQHLLDLDSIGIEGWRTASKYLGKVRTSSYRRISDNFLNIMTSRGCQNICHHCASPLIHGIGIRKHSIEYIKATIEYVAILREQKGLPRLESIKFDDDDLMARSASELGAIGDYLMRKNISYSCSASVHNFTPVKAEIMAKTGLRSIFFGIETHEKRRAEIMRGPKGQMSDEEIVAALDSMRGNGVFTITGYIIGYPDETPEDISKTVETMLELPSDYPILRLLEIYPGTPAFRWMEEREPLYPGLPRPEDRFVDRTRWNSEPIGLPHSMHNMSREALLEIKNRANQFAYLSKERLERAKANCLDEAEKGAVERNYERFARE